MNVEEYHRMRAHEETYWWFQGRRRILLNTLRDNISISRDDKPSSQPRLLDVGCGTGMLLEGLKSAGWTVGLDMSPVALAYCRGRKLQNTMQGNAIYLPLRGNSIDIITAIDVIEHADDDKAVVNELYRTLKPGGLVIMTVPAHKGLWSPHDVALHHKRRYEKEEFLRLVKTAGFQPVKYTHIFSAVYVPVMIYRCARRWLARPGAPSRTDEFPLPRFVNACLRNIVYAEASWLSRHDLPFGTSLLCVARKP
ncbi:MAG: methyltransferase domain-containing protein [bacterium]